MSEDDDDDEMLNPENLPLYRQGREVFLLCTQIATLIDENQPPQREIKGMLLVDAALLTVKVAGAEAGDLYDLRMENATLIRKAARDLLGHCHSLELFGFKEVHYFPLIRAALEAYRRLFVAWVQTFDPWHGVPDRWGLFNPPGVETADEE